MESLILSALVFIFIMYFVISRVLRIFGVGRPTRRVPRSGQPPRRNDEAWGGIRMPGPAPTPPTPIESDPDMPPQKHLPLDIPPPDSPDRIHVPLDPSQPIKMGAKEPSAYRDTFNEPAPASSTDRRHDDPFGGYDPFDERTEQDSNAEFGHYKTKADDITRRLEELESYREQGVITEKEYKERRWEIMQGKR